MPDPVIRPRNGLLLIALQAAEGTYPAVDPTTQAVSVEDGSVDYGSPFTTEDVNEVTGSLVAGAPMVVGQPASIGFRSRIRGAGVGVAYTASVKPPLHAAFQGCGWRGQFQAAIAAAALTAGSATTATLAAGFPGTAQGLRGMPLLLAGAAAGHVPLITDYTAGRLATLSDSFSPVLGTDSTGAIPANWTYAGTSPSDAAARLTDHPPVTISWYEDGNLHRWGDCRGTADLEGDTARPGFGAFRFSGTYLGVTAAAVPTNAVIAGHSAPLLVKGSGTPPAALINRKQLPISRWALRSGGNVEDVVDPNTTYGFGAGQLVGRKPMFEADPLRTLVSTRDAIAEIEAALNYPIALRFGTQTGNRWGLVVPVAQPVSADPSMRGALRADAMGFQALSPGRDAYTRDGDRYISFF
jgi:hypothetical protein